MGKPRTPSVKHGHDCKPGNSISLAVRTYLQALCDVN